MNKLLIFLMLIIPRPVMAEPPVKLPKYTLISDINTNSAKRSVEVMLNKRTNKIGLRALAENLYSITNNNFDRTFICYRIKGESRDQACWATTNYDPDLVVELMGSTQEVYRKTRRMEVIVDGKIIGHWMTRQYFDFKITAYNKQGKVFIRTSQWDGVVRSLDYLSTWDQEHQVVKTEKGFELRGSKFDSFGEYYVITKRGELQYWSKDKKYYTAPKKVGSVYTSRIPRSK